jgi:hypothetical protein
LLLVLLLGTGERSGEAYGHCDEQQHEGDVPQEVEAAVDGKRTEAGYAAGP